eukprot:TRINITY_DN3354_c0_g2_i4.p1 TRINITY_DN3354_c0_g2~~TRINITY_DN3354_c0_g2_i4.p1  ORF type:complete len:569 (-),score=74.11 TRINITY_DN3354_c0_g2_i4:334-2040(-)
METQFKTRVKKWEDCIPTWKTLQSAPVSSEDWDKIQWAKSARRIQHLRNRIFVATKRFKDAPESIKPPLLRKLRLLQTQALFSYDNLLWATRRVTQLNKGSHTPGYDGLFVKTKEDRYRLIVLVRHHIDIKNWEPLPARRTYIRKPNGKLRSLGIPTIVDRIIQAIYKNALEPEWEVYADIGSYGFRPGRSCHDALERIVHTITSTKNDIPRKCWVLDADITGCFDNISHPYLMDKIGNFPGRTLIHRWLKAGYVERGVFKETDCGTPQGGIITPLLANIVLNGIEKEIHIQHKLQAKTTFPYWCLSINRKIPAKAPYGPRNYVRYADDFVILCESKEDTLLAKDEVREALKRRGLEISEIKTKIVHVADDGFDFLGFNVRVYKTKMIDKRTKTPLIGYKPLIKPSNEALTKARKKIKSLFLAAKGKNADFLITSINAFTIGWGNYFLPFVSKKAFAALDAYIFYRCMRWALRTHHNKGKKWIVRKYFGCHCPSKPNEKWVFTTPDSKEGTNALKSYRPYMLKLSSGQTLGVKAQRFRGHTSPHRNVKEKKKQRNSNSKKIITGICIL